MRIDTNPSSLHAAYRIGQHQEQADQTRKKLASGQRVNGAADDAAILAIGQRLNAQALGSYQAEDNVLAGISLLQTADGAMGQSQGVMQRMRELSVQAANGTLNSDDRAALQQEMGQLTAQLDAIADQTSFNGKKLLDGSVSGLSLQVGPKAGDTNTLSLAGVSASDLGLAGISAATPEDAASALGSLDAAMASLSASRSDVGARLNGLQSTFSNLGTSAVNAEASKSRMLDADMALELMKLTKSQVLGQSATAMQAQTTTSAGQALRLLT